MKTDTCKNKKCKATFVVEFKNQEYCKECLNPLLKKENKNG